MFNKTINYPQLYQENLFPGGKILIIEDDNTLRSTLQEHICLYKGHAFSASNGKEALTILKKERFDIIIVDLFMPEMDGEEFIKIFRRQNKETPLVVMSGQADFSHLIRSVREGIDDFLLKPFNSEFLLYRLNSVYQKKRLEKQTKDQMQLLQETAYPEFFYSSPLPMAIINLTDGTYHEVNPKTAELLEYSREELLDKEAHNSKLWDSRQAFDNFRQALIEKGSVASYEATFLSKHGKKIPVLVYGKVIKIKNEPFIIASVIDNSHNKALDNILRFQANSLAFLKETGDEFLNIKNIASDAIYQIIISRVKEILADSCLGIVFGEIDKTETQAVIKHSHFAIKEIETISQKIFNTNFLTHTYSVDQTEHAALLTNKLIPLGNNVYAAMFRNFPRDKVQLLEKAVGKVGQIFVIGFAKDNMLLGGMTIIIKHTDVFFKQELLEAYVKQAAIALKQRRILLDKQASEIQFSTLFKNSNVGMMVLSKKNYIEQCNEKTCQILGYTEEQLVAMKPGDMSPDIQPDQKISNYQSLELLNSVTPDNPVSFEWKIKRGDGKLIDVAVSLNSVIIEGKEIIYGTVKDITLDKDEAFLKEHDKITRLPNFTSLKIILDDYLQTATPFTIFSISLEHKKIKSLSKYYEKDFLDEKYKKLAETLQHAFFKEDIVFRNSEEDPDEFIVLFENIIDPEIIKKLIHKLDAVFPAFDQHKIFADINIIKYPEDFKDKPLPSTAEVLKRIASLKTIANIKRDQLEYKGNHHHFFNKQQEDLYLEKIYLEKYLRENCYKKNYDKIFEIYYQPKMDHNFQLASLEALLRVKHPHLGIITPDKFIDILEESGLIVGVERWLLQKTFGQLKKWQKKFPHLGCSINVHPLNLTEDYVTFFTNALLVSGLNPATVELEIIERAVLNKESISVLSSLRQLGIEISVDDFQTGAANITTSLKHLKDIVTKIKFDRSMVDTATEPLTILKHLMALCHELGKKVIAEGIETKLAANKLKEIGCDYFQGYVFSRPLSVKQLKTFLIEQQKKKKNVN